MVPFIMLTLDYDPEILGFIPLFLDEDDPRPAREQLDANYQHGGGWRPIQGFKMSTDGRYKITYPGDPTLSPIACTQLHLKEMIIVYEHALIAIVDVNSETFEIARMD